MPGLFYTAKVLCAAFIATANAELRVLSTELPHTSFLPTSLCHPLTSVLFALHFSLLHHWSAFWMCFFKNDNCYIVIVL